MFVCSVLKYTWTHNSHDYHFKFDGQLSFGFTSELDHIIIKYCNYLYNIVFIVIECTRLYTYYI